MTSWCPNKEDLLHLQATCPNIKSLKLLMNDKDIYDFAKILEEDCIDFDICQLEIHHINPNFVSTGINRLCVTFANSLVSLKLTILDHLSWHSIQIIGEYCHELKIFHLEVWNTIVWSREDETRLTNEKSFPKLEDFKLKCEDYTEPIPEFVIKYFLQSEHSNLNIVQICVHLSWLTDEVFPSLWSIGNLMKYDICLFKLEVA